jgi:RNA polymerase sigma factor (sigma-70 family)
MGLAWGDREIHIVGVLMPDIRALQNGHEGWWEMAFPWLWRVAWSAAARRLPNTSHADLEDVAILAIREAAEKVDLAGSFEELQALTAIIANRRALDLIRHRQAGRRKGKATESLEDHENLESLEPGPLERVNACELAKLLSRLTHQLPGVDRQLLLAYYFEGLKQSELAERFQIPIGTVGVKLSRALKSLRKELSRYPKLLKEMLEA